FEDGHREPLEITQHVHEATRTTLARLPDGGFDADELDHVWTVWIPECEPDPAGDDRPYGVLECRRRIVPVLAQLEQLGIDRFDDETVRTDVRLGRFAPIVASLGIYAGRSFGPRGNDLVKPLFLRQYARRELGMRLHVIAEAVEAETADEGNRRKLGALEDASRRHLF